MRGVKTVAIATLLVVGGLLFAGGVAGTAEAADGPCSVQQAKRAAVQAERAAVCAANHAREERRILLATRSVQAAYSHDGFTADDGRRIARWVRPLRRAGFAWRQVGQAIAVFARESRGQDKAKNPASTASGLCQWLAFWCDGSSSYGWVFNPFDWRACIRFFERCVNHTPSRWSPWNPVPAPRCMFSW